MKRHNKTTRKQQKDFRDIILSCIDDPDNPDFSEKSNREKVEHMKKKFNLEMSWEIKTYNKHYACTNWLQGLCSTVNLEFMNYKILDVLKDLGHIDRNCGEVCEQFALDDYWLNCATACIQLMNALSNKKTKLFI